MPAVLEANCRLCSIVQDQKLQTQLFRDLKCVRQHLRYEHCFRLSIENQEADEGQNLNLIKCTKFLKRYRKSKSWKHCYLPGPCFKATKESTELLGYLHRDLHASKEKIMWAFGNFANVLQFQGQNFKSIPCTSTADMSFFSNSDRPTVRQKLIMIWFMPKAMILENMSIYFLASFFETLAWKWKILVKTCYSRIWVK